MSEEERLEKRAKRILKTISKELLEGEIVVVYSRIYGVPIKNVGFYNPRRSTPTNLSLSIHKIGPGDIWPVGEGGYIIRGDTIESIETKERGVEELSFYLAKKNFNILHLSKSGIYQALGRGIKKAQTENLINAKSLWKQW